MNIKERETATILGALRRWQNSNDFSGDDINEIARPNGEQDELTSAEIDALCERINVVETATVPPTQPEIVAALRDALDYLLRMTVDDDVNHGIALTEGEQDASDQARAAIALAAAATDYPDPDPLPDPYDTIKA